MNDIPTLNYGMIADRLSDLLADFGDFIDTVGGPDGEKLIVIWARLRDLRVACDRQSFKGLL